MAKRDLIVRLEDIRTRILAIESILQEAGEESSMLKSEVYKLALERSFEIIGEALYQIQKQHEFQPVSDMSRIISLVLSQLEIEMQPLGYSKDWE